MSIRDVLHLDWLLDAADDAWPNWAVEEPVLSPFAGVGDMSRWRLSASWREDREVFLALGRLSLDKRWRHEAQAVLVSNVLPACEAVVRQRTSNGADADYVEQTAAGLVWAVVAEYPWADPLRGWIPQGVARKVARELDREFGWGGPAEPAWRDRAAVEPGWWERVAHPSATLPVNRSRLYWWALADVGVCREDMDRLVALAETATAHRLTGQGSAGVTARTSCARLVAPGESPDAMQARAIRTLRLLRSAQPPAA